MSTTATQRTAADVYLRRRRRLSAPDTRQPLRLQVCQPLPYSLEALDLSTASPTQALASIRFLVLSYLADLENRLSLLESPDLEAWRAKGEMTMEEAKQWASTALDMLESIRADVCSHFPEFHFAGLSVENFRSHLPDLPDVPTINDMRSHLPDMPDVRSHLQDVRSHLPDFDFSDMRSTLDDVRTRFHDLDFDQPLSYLPTLSDRLSTLHSHLTSMELPTGLGISSLGSHLMLSEMLDSVLSSEFFSDFVDAAASEVSEGEDMIERAAKEIANAVKRSLEGVSLIHYSDLPQRWRHNPFVTQGYRFIPIERWPLIVLSLFKFHNETLNIHTHLIPFILWGINTISLISTSGPVDTPEKLFMAFALLCLFSSTVWHTMAGCAHHSAVEFCARLDYVGIGWLISASVGTVVYYGFQCHPTLGNAFLVFCFLTGLAGNIFPFMQWFNQYEYRVYRVLFFLALAFSSVAPLAALAMLHSTKEMFAFISPIVPSLASYIAGLVFYVSHAPERFLPPSWSTKLDAVGIGSHCIWHCFIVLAVSQHKSAITLLKGGMQCPVSAYS